ncbi:MAG: hypothetical protein HY567_02030 [Candidatus Kerfeldbacteria bacterium]|nr:hypothetical protein [Candidatus Kerfeldbacteria bacterium]
MMRRWLIISALLAAAGAAALVVVRQPKTGPATNTAPISTVNRTVIPENTNAEPAPTTDQLLATARVFAERFGSTSSDAPTAHLQAVLPFCSSALTQSFRRLINQPTNSPGNATRTTSRALAFATPSVDERLGLAEVVVTLQRQEQIGTEPATIYNQELALQFVRESGAWKVNVATWGKQS